MLQKCLPKVVGHDSVKLIRIVSSRGFVPCRLARHIPAGDQQTMLDAIPVSFGRYENFARVMMTVRAATERFGR